MWRRVGLLPGRSLVCCLTEKISGLALAAYYENGTRRTSIDGYWTCLSRR